jgi:hypothetical protein
MTPFYVGQTTSSATAYVPTDLSVTGDIEVDVPGSLEFKNLVPDANGGVALLIIGGYSHLTVATSANVSIEFQSGEAVPEPSTLVLALMAVALIAGYATRKAGKPIRRGVADSRGKASPRDGLLVL